MTDDEMQKIAKIIDNKVKDAIRPRDPETGHYTPKSNGAQPAVIHRSGFTYLETILAIMLFALLGTIFGVYLASSVTLCQMH